MPSTSNLSLPYPSLSNAPNVPQDIQNLATAVDTYVSTLENATTKWTSFTPTAYANTITTKSSVTRTVNNAWYIVRNNICFAHAEVTLGAAASNGAGLALPVTAAERWLTCGSAGIFGASADTTQTGVAYMLSDLTTIVFTSYSNAFLSALNGHTLRYNIFYKV